MRLVALIAAGAFLVVFAGDSVAGMSIALAKADAVPDTATVRGGAVGVRLALALEIVAVVVLEAGIETKAVHDTYFRVTLLLELARHRAYRGEVTEAEELLGVASPLCAGSQRASAAEACARAHVASVRDGWSAAGAHLEVARRLSPLGQDPARDAEVEGLRLGAARSLNDGVTGADAEAALRTIDRRDGLARAAAWLSVSLSPARRLKALRAFLTTQARLASAV